MKRNYSNIFSFVLILIFILELRAEQPELSAHQVIEKMGEVYRKCSSYQDSGTVQKIPVKSSNKQVVRKIFKTYFIRPDLFRFEWREKIPPKQEMSLYVVWCKGKETYTYWEIGKFEKSKSLEQAIAANTGVSSGGINTVPLMLINKEKSFIFNWLIDETLIGEDSLNGVKCYVIKAKHKKFGREVELWIGKEDFFLRKLKRKLRSNAILEEIHQDIKINHKIHKEIFNYKPPLGQKKLGLNYSLILNQ